MKIQYPGVADSIESDIENVKRLLTYTNLIPEKLYIDSAMKVKCLDFWIQYFLNLILVPINGAWL